LDGKTLFRSISRQSDRSQTAMRIEEFGRRIPVIPRGRIASG
jgi:hypothetical protein